MDFEIEYKKADKRLSKKSREQILKTARKDGFESCYIYVEHLIQEMHLKPKDIWDKLKIPKYVYYCISNNISLLKRDGVIAAHKQDFKKRYQKKMCGMCGKRPRVGAYFCRQCRNKAHVLNNQIDLDMMGDY